MSAPDQFGLIEVEASLRQAAAVLRSVTGLERVDAAVVLGSGWSLAMDGVGERITRVPYEEIPGFAPPVVPGHAGHADVVELDGARLLCFSGRTHLYEGRGVDAVVYAVRLAAMLGAESLVLTNGCGSVRPDWAPGTPVILADHINLTATTPLIGATFIDCTEVYSPRLRGFARAVDPSLPEGVYAQFRGPQYETPAEVRMAGVLGADLVGMSTALEAIEARRLGLQVLGLSLVTNLAAGVSPHPLDHQEVVEAGRAAAPRLRTLLDGVLRSVTKDALP